MVRLSPLHVGISVTDMDEALAWYKKNLGFHLLRDDGFVPLLNARVCFLENGNFQLELFQYKDPRPVPEERLMPNTDLQTAGTKHVAFCVEDLNSLKIVLQSNGVDIAYEAALRNHVLFIRDCCGTLIELVQLAKC